MYVKEDTIDSSVHATIKDVCAYYCREYKSWYLTVTYKSIESAMEEAFIKIEAAAKEGEFQCWIYEQDINKKDATCRLSDLATELQKLGYKTHVGRDKNDIELQISWGDHFHGHDI